MRFLWLICAPNQNLNPEHGNIIKNHAIDAIRSELESLQSLATYVNDDFAAAVQWILDSHGRLVITGIGKSAIIAQKIVATLNSTGQPAIFMHAADAIHGDLGIIQKDDIVMAISKSGNTPEIKILAPLLRRFGSKLIAMVGNVNSELAHLADYVINTTVDKEACPNNLAPTTSTTAQLMMGDALAIALLQMRDFSGEDFSKYHPGGALGKRLYLRCGELASQHDKPFVTENAGFAELLQEMTAKRLGATAVVTDSQTVVGIITDGDLRRFWSRAETGFDKTVTASDIMGRNPFSVDADVLAADAGVLMTDKKITQLIVTKDDKYYGMVHIHDLNREGIL